MVLVFAVNTNRFPLIERQMLCILGIQYSIIQYLDNGLSVTSYKHNRQYSQPMTHFYTLLL